MSLLHSRVPKLPEFGLSRSTPTTRPSCEAAGSILDRSCCTCPIRTAIQIPALAIVPTMTTLCRCCALNTDVKTREPPAPRGTRAGCKVTGVPESAVVYCPLYMFRP